VQTIAISNKKSNFHTTTTLHRPGYKPPRNPKIGITLEQLRMAARGTGRRLPICHDEMEKVMNSLEAAKYEVWLFVCCLVCISDVYINLLWCAHKFELISFYIYYMMLITDYRFSYTLQCNRIMQSINMSRRWVIIHIVLTQLAYEIKISASHNMIL